MEGLRSSFKALFAPFTDPPRVTIRMGKSLVASDIREGVDVYFNCVIVANPAPRTKFVTWLHNVSFYLYYFSDILLTLYDLAGWLLTPSSMLVYSPAASLYTITAARGNITCLFTAAATLMTLCEEKATLLSPLLKWYSSAKSFITCYYNQPKSSEQSIMTLPERANSHFVDSYMNTYLFRKYHWWSIRFCHTNI